MPPASKTTVAQRAFNNFIHMRMSQSTGTNRMSCLTPIQVDLTGSPQGESYAYENYYIYVMDKY